MGLCICIIMLYHHSLFHIIPGHCFGCLGVDIFLFVSGFGLYYALQKSTQNKQPLLLFYKRRFMRIMPAAIIAGILLRWNFRLDSIGSWLNFTGLGLWYIRTLLILYLLSPLFYYIIIKQKKIYILLIITLCAIGVSALTPTVFESVFTIESMTVNWTLARTPAFFLGMLLPHMETHGRNSILHSKWHTACSIFSCGLAACLIVIFTYAPLTPLWNAFSLYFGWLTFALCLPWLCTLTAKGISHLPQKIQSIFHWMGVRSLEIYVCHEAIYGITRKLILAQNTVMYLVQGTCMIVLSIIAGILLHMLCNLFPINKKKVTAGT